MSSCRGRGFQRQFIGMLLVITIISYKTKKTTMSIVTPSPVLFPGNPKQWESKKINSAFILVIKEEKKILVRFLPC